MIVYLVHNFEKSFLCLCEFSFLTPGYIDKSIIAVLYSLFKGALEASDKYMSGYFTKVFVVDCRDV